MANYIDPYNPIFYAQETLMALENALGYAARVHRGFDAERRTFNKGQVIQISKPSTFTTQAGGTGTAQDLNPELTQINLNNFREVKFQVTDVQGAYTGEKIISDHINPAAYAIAAYIDAQLAALRKDIPWSYDGLDAKTYNSSDITGTRKVLRDIAGTVVDNPQDVHFAVDSTMEQKFLDMNIFHQAQVTGQGNNAPLFNGSLGTRFGAEFFTNQSATQHTSGTVVSAGTDVAGAVNGPHAIRATSLAVNGFSLVETFKKGDSIVIAGHTQRYTVAADATLAAGAGTLTIFPGLKVALAGAEVVTAEDGTVANVQASSYYPSTMFHKNAFALAFAKLPETGNKAGALMASVQDPTSGIAVRSRIAYVDTTAAVNVTLDVLFGVKTLDPNLAVIFRRAA
jgi:hypothetical protein